MRFFKRRGSVLHLASAAVLATMVFSGCGDKDEKKMVLASIGKDKISLADFNERIATLPPQYQDIIKKRKEEYLQELIGDTLLYQEAMRNDINKEEDVRKLIKEASKKIIIARFLQDRIDDVIEVSEEDITAHYKGNKKNYTTPEVLRASHILVRTEQDAEGILKEIEAGVEFEALAKERSIDPAAQKGGDIGYFTKGQLMPEIENACERLNEGEVSDVVKTKLGYHVIMLTERQVPKLRPIGEVEESIRQQVRTVKRREIFNDLLEGLRERTVIRINEDVLAKIDLVKEELVLNPKEGK